VGDHSPYADCRKSSAGKAVPAADGCYNTGKFETRKKDNRETQRVQRKGGELGCGFKSNEDGGKARWERKKASG
jgi:hypothetical protein